MQKIITQFQTRPCRRVLYVLSNAHPGGAELITLRFVALHTDKYQPIVFFLNKGPLVEKTRLHGTRVHCLSKSIRLKRPWELVHAISECREIIRTEMISLVHSCMPYSHLVAAPAAFLSQVPACLFQHGPIGGALDYVASALPTGIVLVNSHFTELEQRRINARRPIRTIPLSPTIEMSSDEIAKYRRKINEEYGLTDDHVVFGMLTRYDPWKGIDVALRGIASLARSNDRLRFFLVGGQYKNFHPDYEKILKNLVKEEQIEKHVTFVGFQTDVRPYLARIDVLVHASIIPEPFGLSVLEAMWAGKAVIASRGGGISDLIVENNNGLLHEMGNIGELREKMQRVAQSSDLRRALGTNAHQSVENRFSQYLMIDALENAYDELASCQRE